MGTYIWIAIGSALGGTARYWCSGVAARLIGETFPWGTFIVNVSQDLPVVVEIVDSQEKIDAFLPVLDSMMMSGLETIEKVRVLLYGSTKP